LNPGDQSKDEIPENPPDIPDLKIGFFTGADQESR
jgi:hypothetical protein